MQKLENILTQLKIDSPPKIPSFDELKAFLNKEKEKGTLELIVNGYSVNRREVFFVKIGQGKKNVAITGGAHADEPFGIATCYTLIKNLVANDELAFLKSEFTFLIHPCLDPDGAHTNYSWANSNSYPDYLLKSFRNNDPANDVEHGIPVKENQTIRPELKVLMNNLLPYKGNLSFYVTLHSTHTLGGSLVLLFGERNLDAFIEVFTKKAKELGSPVMDYRPREDEGLTYIAPGFLKSPSYNDFLKTFKNNPSALDNYKMTTYEWANLKLDCPLCMIAEFPFLQDSQIDNVNPSNIAYREFEKSTLAFNIKIYHEFCEQLKVAEGYSIDRNSVWYKKAVLFREHALKSYQKDEQHFEQFNGQMAPMGEVYYQPLQQIEGQMKPWILLHHLLKDIPEAKSDLEKGLEELGKLSKKWNETNKGHLLTLEQQIKLQSLMIFSGLSEI